MSVVGIVSEMGCTLVDGLVVVDAVVEEDLNETGDWPLYQTGRVLVRIGRENAWTRTKRRKNLSLSMPVIVG